ncbi:MAG TPA: PEGA domain-containing protein [Kofleriaceae bacterium]|nr:PEGA domain-containing protein [Kofleriaceae bacterium]
MLRPLAIAGVLAAATGVAHADRIVAIAPLTTLDTEDTSAATKKLTTQIEAAVAAMPGTKVVPAAQVSDAIKKAKKPQLKSCEGDAACLAEIGRLVGAEIVISGQVGGLGESKIIYLGATDATAGRELRSTTLAVGAKSGADAGGPQGAVVRLLEPDKYRGVLHFNLDVSGATVYVDGSKVALARNEVALPVGTHAVRVTHPEYRDFVRFIDVPYGQKTDVAVGMTQYPIVQRDIQGNPINRDKIVYVDPPLWRRWYVVGIGAVGLAILSGIVVGTLASDAPDAPCRKVGGGSC